MSFEDYNNFASAIQSLIIAISIIIGGIWAIFRCFSLRALKKAKSEVEKLKKELQERAILNVQINFEILGSLNNRNKSICLTLNLTNEGNRKEVIDLSKSRVLASHITQTDERVPHILNTNDGFLLSSLLEMEGITVAPGSTSNISYIVPIEKPGTYLVEALLVGSPEETHLIDDTSQKINTIPEEKGWGITRYIEVKGENTEYSN